MNEAQRTEKNVREVERLAELEALREEIDALRRALMRVGNEMRGHGLDASSVARALHQISGVVWGRDA